MMYKSLSTLLAIAAVALAPSATAQTSPSPLPVSTIEVVATYPHEGEAFTQGLFVHQGILYESSGQVGESALIRHTAIGETEFKRVPLPETVFGEGSVVVGDQILSLTWRAGIGHIHTLETMEQVGTFPINGEGWGLTYDGTRLIMSDGSDKIRFLDPETFEETGEITVTVNGNPLTYLNELEMVRGELWANVWQSDVIARIDLESSAVIGFVDLTGLHRDPDDPSNNVLNGIAWDADADRLFVTGKRWPLIYEITVSDAE